MLDDGRLTDGHGRTVDFRNTVVVMTSNLGSHLIQEKAGSERHEEMKSAVLEIVGQHFRPEFINRLDEIIVFHPLGREQLRAIARIQIDLFRNRLEFGQEILELFGSTDNLNCFSGQTVLKSTGKGQLIKLDVQDLSN